MINFKTKEGGCSSENTDNLLGAFHKLYNITLYELQLYINTISSGKRWIYVITLIEATVSAINKIIRGTASSTGCVSH